MKLIEIRNNLIKLSYNENERPTLGQFIALTGEEKSYVAQYVNLKADNINNFAVAKLMFSFSSDGVVSEYDGSTPSINSNIIELPASELLNLLPVENRLRIGQISGCTDQLDVDASIFEHNFTVFSENDSEKSVLISNCVRQLFRMKEKSVIIDTDSFFEDYPKMELSKDFKLPLNSDFIDYIFEYDLKNVDVPTKAVIQDIFYAVQQYLKTLDDEFLPIENFIDVVTAQYKETQMPELALLKNKLLKYRDLGIFANEADEFTVLDETLRNKNCVVINIKDINGELQKYIINYVHKTIETYDKYVYFFVPLSDDNSDKKLVKRLINHNHVFTTIFASHSYKYASELKSHAQNIMLFAPETTQHDFASYNTFLNKLNPSEGIIYGKLTQGIPLIISLEDLNLDLTKEDVLSSNDIYAINNLQEAPELHSSQDLKADEDTYTDSSSESSVGTDYEDSDENYESKVTNQDNEFESDEQPYTTEEYSNSEAEDSIQNKPAIENILADDNPEYKDEETEEVKSVDSEEVESVSQDTEDSSEEDEDLSFMDEFNAADENEIELPENDFPQEENDQLTEDDLDFIENSQNDNPIENDDFSDEDFDDNENTPIVPVYETEDETEPSVSNIGFVAGDKVSHPRYGNGVVEKIIKYGNKTLCSITFENVGRRLLDPSVSDFEKI